MENFIPAEYHRVENIFRKRGAYSRYKDLLDDRGLVQKWYDFENQRVEAALLERNIMVVVYGIKDQLNPVKALFYEIESKLFTSPADIEIVIKEQPPHCWGFRGMTGDEVRDLKYKVNV